MKFYYFGANLYGASNYQSVMSASGICHILRFSF